jgi:hypothetical protein
VLENETVRTKEEIDSISVNLNLVESRNIENKNEDVRVKVRVSDVCTSEL